MSSSDLIAISTFRSPADAQVAKGIQDDAGIESMIRADNAGGMYPAISGAELIVRAERLDEEPHLNPNTRTWEFSLRDPDGYYVTINAL